jgi:O-antigen/teichoic acid export membrane protein
MSLRNDVLHSLKWLAAARLVTQLIAWAITLIVIRLLKPADYGLMAMAEVVVGFAALFRELGLYSALVQKRDLTDRQVEQTFGFLIVTDCGAYVLVFFLAPLLAAFFGDPRLTNIVRVLGIQFPLAAIGVIQDAMLARSMRFKPKALANVAIRLGNAITTLSFALAGAGVWALVFGSLAGSVVRPIALSMAARHWCRPRLSLGGMGDMLRFGGFVSVTRILGYVRGRSDVFIIGKLLGTQLVGFYSIAMQLASLPLTKVGEMLNQVSLPAYAAVQQNMEALRSHYYKSIRVLSFVAFPIFWGLSSISPELIDVVIGQKWEPAIVPMQLISLAIPLRAVGHGGASALDAVGKPHIHTLNSFISMLIMVPAFLIGTYYWGLVGASMVWVVVSPLAMLVRLRISLPQLGLSMRRYFLSMAGPAAAGAIMYLLVVLTRETVAKPLLSPAAGLVTLIGVGCIAYTAFMWFLQHEACCEMLDLVGRGRKPRPPAQRYKARQA